MNNKREPHLWEQIDRLIFIIAVLGLIILIGAYFYFATIENIDANLRDLILNVITNVVPTFLLFIGAYLVFRRIEKLRSEKDADELAEKVVFKLLQTLSEIQEKTPKNDNDSLYFIDEDINIPIDMKLRQEFDVIPQSFDTKSNPQRITIKCVFRGSDDIYINKIVYKGTNLKVKEHLSDIYVQDGFDAIISREKIKVSSLEPYIFELILAKTKKWKKSEIESWYENLGFLYFDIDYENQLVNISKKI